MLVPPSDLCIFSERSHNTILFHHQGGVDVGDVDAKAAKMQVGLTSSPTEEEIILQLLGELPAQRKEGGRWWCGCICCGCGGGYCMWPLLWLLFGAVWAAAVVCGCCGRGCCPSNYWFAPPCHSQPVALCPHGRSAAMGAFVSNLYAVFKRLHFTYLEINPVVMVGTELYILDLAAKLDQTAE